MGRPRSKPLEVVKGVPDDMFLGFDLGTQCGWAMGHSLKKGGYEEGGSFSCKAGSRTAASPAMCYKRFSDFLQDLWDLAESKENPLRGVYYEKVMHHKGILAAHMYGAYEAQLLIWCEEHALTLGRYTPTTIKKKLTGSGSADKEAMIKMAASLDWRINPVDHNHADAMGVLYCALKERDWKILEQKDMSYDQQPPKKWQRRKKRTF